MYKLYNKFFLSLYIKYNRLYRNIFCMKLNFNKSKFILKKGWKNSLKKFYTIRFSETSVSQHISLKNINSYLFFYIRKNRIFNKGRYSRNRQLYRTGVYWCLWLNIILVYGLYFLFYRFTFNFGYFWWGILILAYSTIFSRVVKYNFYNIYYIIKEFFSLVKWFGVIFQNFNFLVVKFLKKLSFFFKSNLSFFKIIKIVLKIVNDNNRKIVYFWEPLGYKDESFLKHKSLINWFVQVYKVISH